MRETMTGNTDCIDDVPRFTHDDDRVIRIYPQDELGVTTRADGRHLTATVGEGTKGIAVTKKVTCKTSV